MASKTSAQDQFGGNLFTFAESLSNFRQSQIIQEACSSSLSDKSLSLDENLSRLFECLRLEYESGYRLVSPKWKNFRSQKLPFSEKTRLNNAIWRCWHIQYQKGQRPFFCQFASPLSEEREPPKKEHLAVILEGRYWKRKLEAVAREYKRWRVYYKEKWSTSTPDTALENLSIQAQICDQQIFDDLERRQRMRKRTISTDSGDSFSATSPTEYCPDQALKFMGKHMTQDVVLSAFPDTLFTTLTNQQQGKVSDTCTSTVGPTDAPDLFQQPRLDNLQPSLDEFMEQFDSLTNILAQNEAAAQIEKQKQQLQQAAGQMPVHVVNQGISGQNSGNLQVQYTGNPDEIEMMDATDYDPLQVQNYSVNINQPQQACALSPIQPYPPSVGLSASYQRLAAQLEQPSVEQMQQDNNVFTMQQDMTGAVQVRSPPLVVSPLVNSPVTSPTLSSPGLGSPTSTSTATQSPLLSQQGSPQLETEVPLQFRSANLSSSTEPIMESSTYLPRTQLQDTTYQPLGHRKGKLPRNVSDSQLYTMDLSQLGSGFGSSFHNTSLMPSLESDLPPQLQAPNLAAHLQSIPSRTTRSGSLETSSLSGSQPKKARLPRNMSDSGLYNLGNMSRLGSSSFNRQLSTPDQVPLIAGQLHKQIQDVSIQSQAPAQSVRQSRATGKRKGRMPRNMSDSSLMTMQHLPRNMSDSSLVMLQQQQQQQLQAPTVASLLTGNNSSRRGGIPKTQSSLVNLLSSPHTSAAAQTQTFISTERTVVLPSTVPLRQNTESSPSSTPREATQSLLIDQLLREPTQSLVTAPLPTSNFLEVIPMTTAVSQTTVTAKTAQASTLSSILTSSTTTQPMVAQLESTAKMSPQHQLLKHLLSLQKEKEPLPTHLLAALQASVDQGSHNAEKLKQDEKRLQQQHQQQTFQQQLQQLQQQEEQQQIQQQIQQQQQQQQQQQIQQQQQQQIQQQQQQIQQQQQQIKQQQQQQQQQQSLMQAQQQCGQLPKAQQYSQSQTQQQTQQILQQQQPLTEQKSMSAVQALLQIPNVGFQSTQQHVGSGTSQTQSVFPGTIFITPQQLQLNTVQSLQPKIVTLQQNTQQAASPQTVTVQSPVSAAPQVVEIIQGTGPPQQFVLPAGMKIRQAAVNTQPQAVQAVPAVVGAPELSGLLLQQQPQASSAYSVGQSTTASMDSTESIAAALVSMAASPVIQRTTISNPVSTPMVSVAMATSSQESGNERAPEATPTPPKCIRPVNSNDREQYKEHRRISHISAEQKRRGNIKMGFDELMQMVPSLAHQRNMKISKATVLQKTVEYTMKLQRERQLMNDETETLRRQKDELKAEIDACQQQLPATGAPVLRQRSEHMWALFNQYVRSRTQHNYKFWIFSLIIRPLFEAYISTVSTSSVEEFCRTVLSWLDQRCSLPALRPIPVAALRELSQHTSILTEPSKVAEEAQKAAVAEHPTNVSGNFEALFGSGESSSEVSACPEFSTKLR